jgi:hypothetical protein
VRVLVPARSCLRIINAELRQPKSDGSASGSASFLVIWATISDRTRYDTHKGRADDASAHIVRRSSQNATALSLFPIRVSVSVGDVEVA